MNTNEVSDMSNVLPGEGHSAPVNPFTDAQADEPEGQLHRDGVGQPLKPVTVHLTEEHLRLAKEITRSRFYHPAQDGGETPEWFEQCLACHGAGCTECWNTGRVSPHLARALSDEWDEASDCWDAFRHLLYEEKLYTQEGFEAFVALGKLSLQYLTAWGCIEQPNMQFVEGAPDWPDSDEVLKADIRRGLEALERSLDCHRCNTEKFRNQYLQGEEEIRRLRGEPEEGEGRRNRSRTVVQDSPE